MLLEDRRTSEDLVPALVEQPRHGEAPCQEERAGQAQIRPAQRQEPAPRLLRADGHGSGVPLTELRDREDLGQTDSTF